MRTDKNGARPVIPQTAFIASGAIVTGDVVLGEQVSIWHNAVLRGDIARITVGECTNIQDNCTLHCEHGTPLEVGNFVTVGHNAVLHSCKIGDESLIGMGSIILDGAVIGRHCLVGAGSLVTPQTVIPDGSLVMGSPAGVKRTLTDREIESIRSNAREYILLAELERG